MPTITEFKGALVVEALNAETAKLVQDAPRKPHLTIISVGKDPASQVYVRQKIRAALDLGIESEHIQLTPQTEPENLSQILDELAQDKNVTGIVLQLPLPPLLQPLTQTFLNQIPPQKDVDCLSAFNRFLSDGRNQFGLSAATPTGVMALLDHYGVELDGRNVVMIGRSQLVGRPLIPLLLSRDCTLTVCHSHTADLALHTQTADVIISAIGKPHFLTHAHVGKCGPQVLIDVGVSRTPEGLKGDFDVDDIACNALCDISYTPTPGGTGPLTVASLMRNTAILAS